MQNKLIFKSNEQYKASLSDINFWRPKIIDVLQRHEIAKDIAQKLENNNLDITAGFNSTYPVFLIDNLVVKFFGHRQNWQEVFTSECEAHEILDKDNKICTPKILACGNLCEDKDASWSYIISTRIAGNSWLNTKLTREQQLIVVAQLGEQLKYIHALPAAGKFKTDESWPKLDIKAAAQQSSLPKHLIPQIDDFMTTLEPFDRVFVNGDMVSMHVFVKDGNLSGIIDWGDAVVTDRHYEVAKLCLSLFPGDKVLLKTLIDAANWPITNNFAKQTLGMALYRQAVGLTQHNSFDIFWQLPEELELEKIQSLDEYARVLFDF